MHDLRNDPAALPPEVLVVDDNPATRYATSRVLQAAGFGIRQAGTGSEALALAEGAAAVVLDVHLPDIDGYEVCRQLRQRPETSRVPVVHLSAAYVRDDDKVRGLHSGADAYMTHPAEPALLVATVQALVRARRAEDGMRRSESRFRAVFDHALSGLCLIDAAGRFEEANPAMLAMLQRSPEEVAGRPVIDFVPAEWADRVGHYLGKSHRGVWRGDFPLLAAGGRPVHTEWSLSTHVEPGLSMAVVTDISERVALAGQREQLIEREQAARTAAERVSRSKDEFIAVLSHELRTPLNAILGWVHVLKRQQGPGEQLQRGLEAIERNARTQTRLISDLLDVSRMDVGKLRLELESVDLREVVQAACAALAGSAADKGLLLEVDTGDLPQPALVDPGRVQQIVWNLLSNAVKFTDPGGRITLRLHEADDGALCIDVADDGQGIKPEFLPYLFDRFSQSDSASNRYHGGLGLGLSIVKHLVELHGGRIEVHSDGVGHGTAFGVRLPRRPPAPVQMPPGPSGEFGAGTPQVDLSGMDILVVEDDAEAREMLSMVLRERGASVRLARDATEATAALQAARPQVLVSDIGLPGKDGYELMRELRRAEHAGGPRLPAVALTAFARAKDRELALDAGFDAHCAKPLQPNELVGILLQVAHARA
jgi:hypothetical protein